MINTNNNDVAVLMTERELFAQFLSLPLGGDGCTMRDGVLVELDCGAVDPIAKHILRELEKHRSASYELGEYVTELAQLLENFSIFRRRFEEYRLERAVRFCLPGPTPRGYEDGLRYLQAPIGRAPDGVTEKCAD